MQTTVKDAELYHSLPHRKYMSIGKFCYIRFSTLSRCEQQTSLEQNGMCIIYARHLTHVAAAAGEAVAVRTTRRLEATSCLSLLSSLFSRRCCLASHVSPATSNFASTRLKPSAPHLAIHPAAHRTLRTWPGGMREAIKFAGPWAHRRVRPRVQPWSVLFCS